MARNVRQLTQSLKVIADHFIVCLSYPAVTWIRTRIFFVNWSAHSYFTVERLFIMWQNYKVEKDKTVSCNQRIVQKVDLRCSSVVYSPILDRSSEHFSTQAHNSQLQFSFLLLFSILRISALSPVWVSADFGLKDWMTTEWCCNSRILLSPVFFSKIIYTARQWLLWFLCRPKSN